MLKQSQSQKMLQKLSPQQIQLMKLLQVPTVLLDQRIEEELEINPALEVADGAESSSDDFAEPDGREEERSEEAFEFDDDYIKEYMADDDEASYKLRGDSYVDEEDKSMPVAVEGSFHDYLEQQVGMMDLHDEQERQVVQQIVGSIDEDGYLRRDTLSILDDLMFSQNIFVTEAEVEALIQRVQAFDPPGVGARNLQECLLLQLKAKMDNAEHLDDEQWRTLRMAKFVIEKCFDEFTKKHYDKLIRQLDIDETRLKEAIDEVLKLNPKPASGYSSTGSSATQYIVPDFMIHNRDGELELILNSRNAPDLRVSDQYRDMLRSYRDVTKSRKANRQEKEAVMFIKQKIESAKWFIDAILQRQQTMYNTMYAIMQYQYDFFLTGDEKRLRPMILKDISDITGLDISTISRVAGSKFVQTEFGTKRLKDFFSEGMQTTDGEEVSTQEVKKILEEVISAEDKRKPLSDEKLTELLTEKGYEIARRTVAKYREQLNIPVARLRKVL